MEEEFKEPEYFREFKDTEKETSYDDYINQDFSFAFEDEEEFKEPDWLYNSEKKEEQNNKNNINTINIIKEQTEPRVEIFEKEFENYHTLDDNEFDSLLDSAKELVEKIDNLELELQSRIKAREQLEKKILSIREGIKNDKEALDITTHAIEILREVSDSAVKESYKFIEKSLNASLERMFKHTVRKIHLNEYTRGNQYPQLEFELIVGNGKKRSLKADSGHGLAQIVSLLSILTLIVITNSRRILVMDEIISSNNMKIVTDILWTFTEIGFQFIINEHGYIPYGAKVYHLEMENNVSGIKDSYLAEEGVYKEVIKIEKEEELEEPEYEFNGQVISL